MTCTICGKILDACYYVGEMTICESCASLSIAQLADAGYLKAEDLTVEVEGVVSDDFTEEDAISVDAEDLADSDTEGGEKNDG